MVDTVRTLSALQTLLADNTSGDISAQDVRDFLVSVYGETDIASVDTSQTTTSIPFTDLATVGPAGTVTVSDSGLLVVHISSRMDNSNGNDFSLVGVALSGANTISADDGKAFGIRGQADLLASRTVAFTGLTAGSTTATLKYRVTGGTGTFEDRQIVVETKPGIT